MRRKGRNLYRCRRYGYTDIRYFGTHNLSQPSENGEHIAENCAKGAGYCCSRETRPRIRPRSLPSSTAFRSRTAVGVTSTHSSSAQNSSACSRLSNRGGTSRSTSSAVDWREVGAFFFL